ncbi:MAG: hypothetical protein AB8F95_11025 [Bacteroidia bacterium]
MNIWDHSRISVRKFGGKERDYFPIHKFIDSSKLFYFHAKHRLLLHHLWGIELCILKFGDLVSLDSGRQILVRDIAAEHIKEDLLGRVPSISDWLTGNETDLISDDEIPEIEDKNLNYFINQPLLKSNLKSSLLITYSDFGVYLANEFLGKELAIELHKTLPNRKPVSYYLQKFQFTEKWQFSPDPKELAWLKEQNHEH